MKTFIKPTWIVIADSSVIDTYKYNGPDKSLSTIEKGHFENNIEKSQDLVTDNMGTVFNRVGNGRSSMPQNTDPKKHEKHRFTMELKDFLEAENDNFERLIISAPPKMLGDFRKAINKNIKSKIIGEIDKDLTNVPKKDLASFLDKHIYINQQDKRLSEHYLDS
jgi:protein required for attachment to host cells